MAKIVDENALSAIASDIKNALSEKADSNDVYSKTEIDNALDLKADKSELYNVYPTEQESGSIAHITDGADNIPVKSLVSEIVAVESGNGQPKSPTNPYSISGFSSGIVSVCGVNVWNEVYERGYYDASGNFVSSNSQICSKNLIAVKPDVDYYFRADMQRGGRFCYYDASGNFINRSDLINNLTNRTHTIPNGVYYIKFHIDYNTDYNNNLSINYPSTDTQYHAYNGNTYTFAFGQTVYGGHFDNKGNLVVTHKIVDMGLFDWNYLAVGDFYVFGYQFLDKAQNSNEMCSCYKVTEKSRQSLLNYELGTYNLSNAMNYVVIRDDDYTDATAFKTAMNGQKLVYELATPTTLAIISQDIPTLLGENNIFSDTGDVEVDYHADIGLYIDKKISSLAQA